jgi:hypothetical protein
MFQEGQQAIYCLGDKEEQVTILKIHPDSITIHIPSTNKERDTLPERLKPIVEKDYVFELPEHIPATFKDVPNISLKEVALYTGKVTDTPSINTHFNKKNPNLMVIISYICQCRLDLFIIFFCAYISDIYKEVDNLESRDNVLLENQKLMFDHIKKQQKEIDELKLILKSQKDIHELELKELRKLIKTEDPVVDIVNRIKFIKIGIQKIRESTVISRSSRSQLIQIKYNVLDNLLDEYEYRTGRKYNNEP